MRGAPHKFVEPSAIPCQEISDAEKLCQNPLVSVNIITFNHAPYLAQAIESIINQECEFEFEVLIGEDCSSDSTRSVCLDYQRKYPGIIRVLFSEMNVGPSANWLRIASRSRGTYMALCEGDDYWTDPLKLKKQVALLTQYPSASACVAFNNKTAPANPDVLLDQVWPCGIVLTYEEAYRYYFHTSTYVFRATACRSVVEKYSAIDCFCDSVLIKLIFDEGGIVCLPEKVSVYRVTGSGIHSSLTHERQYMMTLGQSLLLYIYGNRARDAFYIDTLVTVYPHVILGKVKRRETGNLIFWRFLFFQLFFMLKGHKPWLLGKYYLQYIRAAVCPNRVGASS